MVMRNLLIRSLTTAVAAVAISVASSSTVSAASCEISGVERVVAIGDVHGAYDRYVEILRETGLIDADLKWTGGKTHLVQLGDTLDRGPDSRKALELTRRLIEQAAAAGGQVHQLLGNHEIMRMLGDTRYVTPGEFQAFVTDQSEQLRKRFLDTVKPEIREEVLSKTPLGWVEMRLAFQPDGDYAKWLTTLNTVVNINGVMFLHGGISPPVADQSCETINDMVRRDMTADFEKTISDPLKSLAAREDGPLWYRGLVLQPDTFESEVDTILTKQHVTTIVVAHTVTSNRIVSRWGGKVYAIDTGMQPAYVQGGRASALEFRNGSVTAIYTDRRDVLSEKKPAPQ